MKILEETFAILEAARERSPAILASYSGGKDARAVIDLCKRRFDRVEAFFMYLVPNLECVDMELEAASKAWGIPTIRQYPHPIARENMAKGRYCFNSYTLDDVPEWTMRDVYDLAMHDSGIPMIATGMKRADGMMRRRNLALHVDDRLIHPIIGWRTFDVFGYLASRGIPTPVTYKAATTAIDLTTQSLLWLHATYPADFRKLLEVFPLAEAVIWRAKWHGVTGDKKKDAARGEA